MWGYSTQGQIVSKQGSSGEKSDAVDNRIWCLSYEDSKCSPETGWYSQERENRKNKFRLKFNATAI